MEREVFGRIMDNPQAMGTEELEALHRERDAYPYCTPLQVLSLMADKMGGTPLWEAQTLPRVSLYMMDVNRLHTLLEHPDSGSTVPRPATHQTRPSTGGSATPAATEPKKEEPYDILKEINSYQEVSFKTAPKSVILSNFLKKDGGIRLDGETFEEIPVQELAKKSIQQNEPLETETMAFILEEQGKIEQAIGIYKKLISKNPEKSSIFAARIAEAESRRRNEL